MRQLLVQRIRYLLLMATSSASSLSGKQLPSHPPPSDDAAYSLYKYDYTLHSLSFFVALLMGENDVRPIES